MRWFVRKNRDTGIYIDDNQKIQSIGTELFPNQLKKVLGDSRWPLKFFGFAFIAGTLTGIILYYIY